MSECPVTDTEGTVRCLCDVDGCLRFLADRRRRDVVVALETHETDWIDVDSLVDSIIETDDDRRPGDWKAALHHVHLPMLQDVGLIEYDEHDRMVRYFRCELVSSVLDVANENRSLVDGA